MRVNGLEPVRDLWRSLERRRLAPTEDSTIFWRLMSFGRRLVPRKADPLDLSGSLRITGEASITHDDSKQLRI